MDDHTHEMSDQNPKIRAGHIKWKIVRDTKIHKALDRLKHACECSNIHCTEIDCDEMKSIVVHSKLCSKEPKKNCFSCRQLIALCLYHAKRSKECESDYCLVPHCAGMKYSLMIRKKKQRKRIQGCSQETDHVQHPMVVVDDEETDVVIVDSSRMDVNMQPAETATTSVTRGRQTIARSSMADPRSVTQEGLLEEIESLSQMPKSPERDRRVLDILKAHPYIMADIIRMRQFALEEEHPSPSFSNAPPTPNQNASSHTMTIINTTIRGTDPASVFRNLLHAHICQIPCNFVDCAIWKNIYRHAVHCAYSNCTVLHCSTSKFVLNHWGTCADRECQLCTLIKSLLPLQQKFWETCTIVGCRFCTPMRLSFARSSTF